MCDEKRCNTNSGSFPTLLPSPHPQLYLFRVCQKLINFLARWRKLVSDQREAEKLTAQEAAGSEVAQKLQARIRDAELRFVDATTTLNDRVAEVTDLRNTVTRKKAKIEALKIQVLGEAAGAALKVCVLILNFNGSIRKHFYSNFSSNTSRVCLFCVYRL